MVVAATNDSSARAETRAFIQILLTLDTDGYRKH
jgi:hypothetical protein